MKNKYQELFDKLTVNTDKDDNVMIIDGTNLFIRCFSSNPLISENGEHIGGLYGFLISLGSYIRSFNPTRCIVVFDGQGGSLRRKKLFPEYKANRANRQRLNRMEHFQTLDDEIRSMKFQFTRLYDYLQTLPLTTIAIDNIEADDTIAFITKQYYSDKDNSVTIVSTDRDFYQLIDERISVYSPQKKIVYTPAELESQFEFHPNNYLLYRALSGDIGDNIHGIKGVGLKTFNKIFESSEETSIEEFQSYISEMASMECPKIITEISQQFDLLIRNYHLMQLHDVDISGNAKISITNAMDNYIPQLDKTGFKRLCLEDEIHMNFKNANDWLFRSFNTLNTYGG